MAVAGGQDGGRAFMDLHCHTSASFDCLSAPAAVVRAAASRGLTHLAVTDHETVDGALEARDAARTQAPDLTVIVGEEVRTREGDLIALYIERAVPRGLSVTETIAAVREQGGLIGVPHPFDRYRGSLLRALAGSPSSRRWTGSRSTTRASWSATAMPRPPPMPPSTVCPGSPCRTRTA